MLNVGKTAAKFLHESIRQNPGEDIRAVLFPPEEKLEMSHTTRTEWLVNKLFTNRGWEVVLKNGKNVICKRF